MKRRIGILALLVLAVLAAGLIAHKTDRDGEKKLNAALKNATLLRIRSGGICHRDPDSEKVLLELKDPAEIARLISKIHIESIGGHCMCCGDPTLEFYRGDELVVMLGFHHGQALRWPGGWQGDGQLTPVSQSFIIQWLADRGVTGPKDEQDAEASRELARQRKVARATRGFSPGLRRAFTAGESQFAAALRRDHPEPADQVPVLFQVLGASNDSWTSLEWVEQHADNLLRQYGQDMLATATEQALRADDRQTRRGAARFWMSWRSPLEEWRPPDAPSLHRIVLSVQQSCRYYPERQAALRNLQRWHSELSAPELAEGLSAGLRDPHPSVRRQAMLVAGELHHTPSIPHLRDVLHGTPIQSVALPEVPPSEQEDVPEGFDNVAAKAPEAEVAALALGWLSDSEIEPVLKARRDQSPQYVIALAMLNHPELLTQAHFQSGNQAAQLAAVEAVIRCRGRAGLDLAMNYRQATHWWEEEHVAGRLRTMLLANSPPGEPALQSARTLGDLRAWHASWGGHYSDQLR